MKTETNYQLRMRLYKLTGCKTIIGVKRKISIIERSYTEGKIPSTKRGYMKGIVMSDEYQEWAHQRVEAEEIINQLNAVK